MPTPKESATADLLPLAQIYRIPQAQFEVIEQINQIYTHEDVQRQLNMLLIAGIKDAYYDCNNLERADIVTLVYDLIRFVAATNEVFINDENHVANEFEEAS